jgi:hypothetical protein
MNAPYNYVNWMDGMRIHKDHFVQTDNANKYALLQAASVFTSPIRFGILPFVNTGREGYEVQLAVDNQNTLRVHISSIEAVTLGGHRISIQHHQGDQADGINSFIFPFTKPATTMEWWVVLLSKPFHPQPYGTINLDENPPRLPYLRTGYEVQLLTAGGYEQFVHNPAALFIGKLQAGPNEVLVADDYIPPCYSPAAHPDLASLCGEFDNFLSSLEQKTTFIVQKIFTKNQQNELSELVQFVCDRMLLHLSQSITHLRWTAMHESPAELFASASSLARVIKNALDMRLGSGKEEMMNYIVEWSELKQGELDALLTHMATMRFNNNDVNANIGKVIQFVSVLNKLFDTLSKLEYIGKKKESGYFVNEAPTAPALSNSPLPQAEKPKRRFFG